MTIPKESFLVAILLLALPGFAAAQRKDDYLSMPPLGAGWKLAQQKQTGTWRAREFVREGEALDNWSEQIYWQAFKKDSTSDSPETAVNKSREYVRSICPDVVWNIVERKERAIVFEWRIADCSLDETRREKLAKGFGTFAPGPKADLEKLVSDQHAIHLYIEGDWTIWRIGYTARVKELPEEKRAEWIQRFLDTRVETK